MAHTVLVGSTGFVGGNLLKSHSFDAAYHSKTVSDGFGKQNDLVIYAGVPAAMFLANQDPEADLAVMRAARENIRKLSPKKLVLISSVCVFEDSRQKSEANEPEGENLPAYGANRLQLEKWVRQDFPDALIVRLPALYGYGLKKNFLFDMHTITPAMLRPAKYEELAAKSELVKEAYSDAGNQFYKLNGTQDADKLKEWFAENDFNALSFTDSRSMYQFYDLRRLWSDIQRALELDLRVLHLATPPVSAAQVYTAVMGGTFKNELANSPFDYDLRTLYAEQFGGEAQYLCTKEQELKEICAFMKGWTE